MPNMAQTILEVVNHILVRHPELAPAVEDLAAKAQGKSLEDIHNYREWKHNEGLSLQQIFTRIYDESVWGQSADQNFRFFSGTGSHETAIVDAYVDAIQSFAAELGSPVDALDLGCGDFNVGARIRPSFAQYTACDIVPGLIEANQQRYAGLDVTFRCLDLTRDELPMADVVFVRQVLQHLSNQQIAAFLSRIAGRCRYLIVTEHWPTHADFIPNIDKPAGGNIRLGIASGVVLTAEPFNLRVADVRRLCTVPQMGGQIVTTAYTMA